MTVTVRSQAPGAFRITFSSPARGTFVELTSSSASRVRSLWTLHDFNQRTAQAEIQVRTLPEGVTFWDEVRISAGATPETIKPCFAGYVVPLETDLAPIEGTIHCRGRLIRAYRHPNGNLGGQVFDAATQHWVSYGASWAHGGTDQELLGAVLDDCGLDAPPGYSLDGTGRVLGTLAINPNPETIVLPEQRTPYAWAELESGGAFVERLDEISVQQDDSTGAWGAWRTYDGRWGTVLRSLVSPIPGRYPVATFEEGLDIERARWTGDVEQSKTRIRVTGWTAPDGTTVPTGQVTTQAQYPLAADVASGGHYDATNPIVDPWDDHPSLNYANPLLEVSTTDAVVDGAGISCEEMARYLMARENRVSEVVTWTTPRDIPLDTAQTIRVTSPRMGVDRLYWVGGIKRILDEHGWRMEITGVGGMGPSSGVEAGVQGSFTITVEQELVVVDGAEVPLYVASCTPAVFSSSGEIVSYAWTATGGTPSSGSGETFVTSYDALSGQVISLLATDASGASKPFSQTVPSAAEAQVVRRELYLAGTTALEDLDVTQADPSWAQQAASAGTVTTNGPVWGDGDTVWRTADHGATWSSSVPHSGTSVCALWVETDVDASQVLAGLADGNVYRSADGGASWTHVGRPDTTPVLRVVINRFSASQWFALSEAGLWQCLDGSSWQALQTAEVGEAFRDVAFSWDRGYLIVMSGGRLAVDSGSVEQTFPDTSGDIVAVTARIRGGYAAYDSDGATFLEGTGDTAFAAATALPTGGGLEVQPRGLWRDGAIPDLLYVAGGAGGAWKSLDGFGSAEGLFLVREPGVGSSPGDAVYTQIGSDGLLRTVEIAATPVADRTITSSQADALVLEVSPSGGWSDAVSDSGSWTSGVVWLPEVARPAGASRWFVDVTGEASIAGKFTWYVFGKAWGFWWWSQQSPTVGTTPTRWTYTFPAPLPRAVTAVKLGFGQAYHGGSTPHSYSYSGTFGWVGGPSAMPVGWQQPAFDASGWSAPVADPLAAGQSLAIADTEALGAVASPDAQAGEEVLIRQQFALPAGSIASASLAVEAADTLRGVWVNGLRIEMATSDTADGTAQGSADVPPAALHQGADNTIALEVANTTHAVAWGAFRLEVG